MELKGMMKVQSSRNLETVTDRRKFLKKRTTRLQKETNRKVMKLSRNPGHPTIE